MSKFSCRKAFTSKLEEMAVCSDSLFLICTDSRGSVTAGSFAKKFPHRFIEVGIAEQNAVGIAAGLASTGKNVFVAGPACFLSARSYEQIKIDVAYNQQNVKIVGVSAGISYGPLGGTHTTLHDFAGIRAIADIELFVPSDAQQTAFITEYLCKSERPAYMRTGRGDVNAVYKVCESFDIHKAKHVMEGSDVTIIACGEMVHPSKMAAEMLSKDGINARMLDMFCLKPSDEEAIIKAANETRAILTVEEHSISGGLGELVCSVTANYCPVPVKIMALPDCEIKVGSSAELFVHYGFTPENIALQTKKLISAL